MKRAQLIAEEVFVVCPSCGERQPNPDDGGELWVKAAFRYLTPDRYKCVSCDQTLMIATSPMVQFK